MDNEHLFAMLDECIAYAQEVLVSSQNLHSFAMVLEPNNDVRSIDVDEQDGERRYEALLQILREEAREDKITAMALLSNVTIPENFSPAVPSGIRIHIEERSMEPLNRDLSGETELKNFKDKLSARLLYVPYQLYRTKESEEIHIHLHDPIPVGLACEVFV